MRGRKRHGDDREHGEVHEGQPAPDRRPADPVRDVEHLRDRGDVAEGVRPGRDRQERALRPRVLPRRRRGRVVVVHAARRIPLARRRGSARRLHRAARPAEARTAQERHGHGHGSHGPARRQPGLVAGPGGVPDARSEEVPGPAPNKAQRMADVRMGRDLSYGGVTMVTQQKALVESGRANDLGYKTFRLGGYEFELNAYFTIVRYPGGEYHIPVGEFMRAVQRDIGWNFFYGMVKFDEVFGTFNFYEKGVDMFLGKYNDAWQKSGKHYSEMFPNEKISATFKAILEDWVPPDFNPWAAPRETGSPFGRKRGGPHPAIFRKRIVTTTMIKTQRTDDTHPVNEAFQDLLGKDGEMKIKPEYAERFGLLNLYEYLARNDVTWNPEIVSAVEYSLFCPTTEEYILPITHGNDRVEWFLLLNGQISMEVRDRDTGILLAYLHMKPGDCTAMPADISHNLWAPERSMLLVWENGNPQLPELIRLGETPTAPLEEFGLK